MKGLVGKKFTKARCTNIELYGVQFTNKAEYEKTKHVLQQLENKGLLPTQQRVLGIRSVVTGEISMAEIKRYYNQTMQ